MSVFDYQPQLTCVAFSRIGFRFAPNVIQALIPMGTIGTYLLLCSRTPIYVGRSDRCLRTRLSGHSLLSVATHFVWEPAPAPINAFLLEAFWYHRLAGRPNVLNVIHPAMPSGRTVACPFCDRQNEMHALRRALGRD